MTYGSLPKRQYFMEMIFRPPGAELLAPSEAKRDVCLRSLLDSALCDFAQKLVGSSSQTISLNPVDFSWPGLYIRTCEVSEGRSALALLTFSHVGDALSLTFTRLDGQAEDTRALIKDKAPLTGGHPSSSAGSWQRCDSTAGRREVQTLSFLTQTRLEQNGFSFNSTACQKPAPVPQKFNSRPNVTPIRSRRGGPFKNTLHSLYFDQYLK
ncbi:hypothetical protein IRJ41_011083 [Triplophysa rosa]|uniref:Uncharacterized protein n=1 Tax=Triplophysa rosa TaxID=992332 RepID=A0A9W7TWL1_TRIRA|nr:hypothetical protein IRJ41_011083 [Triplophysa rosa]